MPMTVCTQFLSLWTVNLYKLSSKLHTVAYIVYARVIVAIVNSVHEDGIIIEHWIEGFLVVDIICYTILFVKIHFLKQYSSYMRSQLQRMSKYFYTVFTSDCSVTNEKNCVVTCINEGDKIQPCIHFFFNFHLANRYLNGNRSKPMNSKRLIKYENTLKKRLNQ